MEETKIYKKKQIFEDGSNYKAVRPGVSASAVLAKFLQAPSVIMHQQRHSLLNFNVEELVELPIPPENRF